MTEPDAEHDSETPRGKGRLWDYEECPVDGCDGELQQQDKFNVMCLTCEAVFTHWKDGDTHRLLDKDDETVAKKARMVPDGGTELPFEDWLTEQLEGQREKYQSGTRSENPRQTDIALGRLRAYRDARTEYLNRKHDTEGDNAE